MPTVEDILNAKLLHARHTRADTSWRSIVSPQAAGSSCVLFSSVVRYSPVNVSWRGKLQPRWLVSSGHAFWSLAEADAEADRLVVAEGWSLTDVVDPRDGYRDWNELRPAPFRICT